jgi:C4-dicarboxylate transporter DctM subunit
MSLGLPIAFSFALVGAIGLIAVKGLSVGLFTLGSAPWTWSTNSALLSLALFVLMGQFVFFAGISTDLYEVANKWVGRFRGGLAIGTELASTAFGACCGLSIAASATMGTIAFPEMMKFKYDKKLACGTIAAGGSLSSLIPPSAPFIVYGFLTETSIGKLFIAGVFPGLLLSAAYITVIILMCWRNSSLGPAGASFSLKAMVVSLKRVWAALVLIIVVLGGLFAGIFAPSEAGAIGAFGAFIIFLAKRQMTRSKLFDSLKGAILNTCFVLTITTGAMIFTNFLTVSGFSGMFTDWVKGLPLSHTLVLICILFIYIPLGCFMDVLAMSLLTIPIVFPIVKSFGVDPVWFGVMMALLAEMGLMTPPVGMNGYVVHGVTKVPLGDVFRGIMPFVGSQLICLVIIFIFPAIATYLPAVVK